MTEVQPYIDGLIVGLGCITFAVSVTAGRFAVSHG